MPLPEIQKEPGHFAGCHYALPGIHEKLPVAYDTRSAVLHRFVPRRNPAIAEPNPKKHPLIRFLPNGKWSHF